MLTSTALPGEGSLVDFLLENRDSPLCGIYHLGRFESRWFHYAPPTVYRWRIRVPQDIEAPLANLGRGQRHCLFAAGRFAAAA
jgi:hypothetical protein